MNFTTWIDCTGDSLASMIKKAKAQQGAILDMVVGIVGGYLGGWLLALLFEADTINASDFSLPTLFVPLFGALVLLALVNFFRHPRSLP